MLAAGTATTLTNISLAAAVPPIAGLPVRIDAEVTPATAGDKVSFAPAGSTATLLAHLTGSVAAIKNSGQFLIPSGLVTSAATIQYINSAASGSTNVWVNGFNYSV